MRSPIAKEGVPFIGFFLLSTIMAAWTGFFVLAGFLLCIAVFVLFFFRDPKRIPPTDMRSIVSPADGKVIQIREIPAGKALECPSIQLSVFMSVFNVHVFMSVFNVHVNRMPFKGKTLSKKYNPGKFLPAFREKASLLNEQTSILLVTKGGLVRVTQIAGMIARRIVCRIQEGETLVKGDRFGLIKFGSRLDVYLPKENTQVVAQIGDKVKAGETVLANFYSLKGIKGNKE